MLQSNPYIIRFESNGGSDIGYLSFCESENTIPFKIKRTFWAYYTPHSVIRGRHAHHETEMVLIAVAGKIIVTTEMPGDIKDTFILENPDEGLYLPKLCWHTMQYSHNAVQLVLTSTLYSEADYIREYEKFRTII